MSNFDDYNRRIQQHDRFHTWHVRNLRTVHHEISCTTCYPPEDDESFPSLDAYIRFERFWDWVSEEHSAESYTSYTQQYFRRLCQNPDRYRTFEYLGLLIYSIRYTQAPDSFIGFRQDLYNAFQTTENFQVNVVYSETNTDSPPILSPIHIPEDTDSDRTIQSDIEELQLSDDSDDEDYHLDLLFGEMAAQAVDIQNLTAAVTALNNAFGAPNWNNVTNAVNKLQVAVAAQNVQQAARGHGLVHPPSFHGGSQDPVAWLTEFNQAADANGWNAARKCAVVPAYLKGVAAVWYQTTNAANALNAWNNPAAVLNSFEHQFELRFRTPALIETWSTELDQRQQKPNENVDDYAADVIRLYQRVNTAAFAYPDAVQARKFIQGLRPELYMAVKPFQKNTLAGAIQRAKDCETTLQHGQQKLMSFSAQKDNTTTELMNVVTALTQQIANMEQRLFAGNANIHPTNQPIPSVAANTNVVARRPPPMGRPLVCYSCGQPGHISRRCPLNTNPTNIPPAPTTNSAPTVPIQRNPTPNNAVTVDAAVLQQLINKVTPGPSTNPTQSLN